MCECNESICKFDIEDIISKKKLTSQYNLLDRVSHYREIILEKNSTSPNFLALNVEQSSKCLCYNKYSLQEFRPKSRSDSDLYLSKDYKNLVRHKDSEVSSFPSDSDITVIRIQRRSGIQRIVSHPLEQILGDGYHVVESQSMVNLATLVQTGLVSAPKEECLIPLSSWDRLVYTPTTTESETTVQLRVSRVTHWDDLRSRLSRLQLTSSTSFSRNVSACKRLTPIINPEYTLALVETSAGADIYNKLINIGERGSIVLEDDLNDSSLSTTLKEKPLNKDLICSDTENRKINSEIKQSSLSMSKRNEKLFVRLSASVQKTLRRALCFSCLSVRRDLDRSSNNDLDI